MKSFNLGQGEVAIPFRDPSTELEDLQDCLELGLFFAVAGTSEISICVSALLQGVCPSCFLYIISN